MEITLKLWQYDWIFSKQRYPAMVSAWGTGKTMCAIDRALLYTKGIPENLGVIFRKEFSDLQDSTIKDFESYTGRKLNSRREVPYDNKSVIMFRHLEELNNIMNINLGWFLIEQAEELDSDKEFNLLRGRLRRAIHPDAEFLKLGLSRRTGFIIANTKGHNWIYQTWKRNILKDDNYHLIEAVTDDNKDVLPADYIEDLHKLEAQAPATYRRFVLNSWDEEDVKGVLITDRMLEALENVQLFSPYVKKLIACDPSEGGDECVIQVFENEHVVEQKILHENDTMKIVGELMILGSMYGTDNYVVDSIGIGKPICDRLWELVEPRGGQVIRVQSAEKASDPLMHYNRRTEIWWYVAEVIRARKAYPIRDPETRRQLVAPRYEVIDSNGKICLEPKKYTKERLGRSPDRGDCYVYGIWGLQFVEVQEEEQPMPTDYSHYHLQSSGVAAARRGRR